VSFHVKQHGHGWQCKGMKASMRSLKLKVDGFEELTISTLFDWVKAHAAKVAGGEAPALEPPTRMGRPPELPTELEALIIKGIRDLASAASK
jgi:hypothetical protein